MAQSSESIGAAKTAAELTTMHNTANSILLRLPGEIRNRIYKCFLECLEIKFCKKSGTDKEFLRIGRRERKKWKTSSQQFAFIKVCRQMYEETRLLPFRATTWSAIPHIIHEHTDGPATLMYRKQFHGILRRFNDEQIAAIENLEVQILMFQNDNSTTVEYQNIGAGYDLILPYCINEQRDFPEESFESLRKSEIVLTGLRNISLVFTGIAARHLERIWHTALVGVMAFAGLCPKGFDIADKRYAFERAVEVRRDTWNVVLPFR
ncbi:hypothetical protein DM02DRAFT_619190 [Periconia macrospinosa]|uniref:Uncharacterized protein n=1 Tax=Periconia macrospinosa TaxID=97972 RepID=A0A2V1D628_9PLEO|nr:hypothetical protein DM02DRAFT_619190 [Periconia macrospinosa]